MPKEYIVQKGDTLSSIAKQHAGSARRYLELAGHNDIDNPDLIKVGQKIIIPDKFDKPLDIKEIPTKNKVHVIDNYSPNYNYIVEDDKIYYSRKGRNDYWVDISDNPKARKNLYNFLNDKYQLRGYEDNEKQILEEINKGTYDYNKRNKQSISGNISNKRQTIKDLPVPKFDNGTLSSDATRVQPVYHKDDPIKSRSLSEEDRKTWVDKLGDLAEKGKNYIKRQIDKHINDNDEVSVLQPSVPTLTDSQYQLIPASYTGNDTVFYDRQYIVPESIDLNNARLGVRNRGDYTPLETEGGIITAFHPFEVAGKYKGKSGTYMGTDKNGNFKVGPITDFEEADLVSRTFENELVSFSKDDKGNQRYKSDAKHGNASRSVPIVKMLSNGKEIEGSLNILTDKNQKGNTYGNITGGRLIVKAGNEYRLLSGSIETLEGQIEDIKKRHNLSSVKVYTLDNGSFNRGLRTKDKKLTSKDLRSYDNQNNGGGNFMYLMNEKYSTDTIPTPNIRTKEDASYKKGHPLENERKGILLHHTGFTNDDDLTNVTKLLTTKGGNSAHVVIGKSGHRRVLADPKNVTFHAGESRFNNRSNVNDFMVGIEFQGDTNKADLTNDQIQSAVNYMLPVIRENNISLENITTHEEVRKLYNEYAKSKGDKIAPNKPDITYNNYVKILDELKKRVYYKKPNRQTLETQQGK